MPYKPRAELPAQFGDQIFPNVMQTPAIVKSMIRATPSWFSAVGNAEIAADKVVDYYGAVIDQFVGLQRRNYAQAGLQISQRSASLPGLDLRYDNQQGKEVITIVVSPENAPVGGGTQTDLNYDGYICWVHEEVGYPNVVVVGGTARINQITGPWDIFLNGYLIYKDFKITQQSSGFVIMFGQTSLRCHSLNDKDNPFLQTPGLTNSVVPYLPKIKATEAPDNELIPQHDDVLLYPLFDWNSQKNFNPAAEVQTGSSTWVRWPVASNGDFPPQIESGVQFKFPANSPLVNKGQNFITIMLSPGGENYEIFTINCIFAEFYDRKKCRSVSTSWNYTTGSGITSITVNDKPRFFGMSIAGGGDTPTFSMGFDLTPGQDKPSSDDALLAGIGSPLDDNLSGTPGLSAQGTANLIAYQAEVSAIVAAFNASHQPALTAALNTLEAAFTTQFHDKVTYDDDLLAQIVGQQDYAFWEAQVAQDDDMANQAGLALARSNLAIDDDNVTMSKAALTIADEALTTADDNYLTLAIEKPTIPPLPGGIGAGISGFVWRSVTVTGDDWTFGEYSGG